MFNMMRSIHGRTDRSFINFPLNEFNFRNRRITPLKFRRSILVFRLHLKSHFPFFVFAVNSNKPIISLIVIYLHVGW